MAEQQPLKVRCQSCGVPLDDWFYATNADDSENKDYCRFCYAKGVFVEPDLTVDQMIQRNMEFMTVKLKIDETKSREFSYALYPTLKRWKKDSLD